MEWETKKTRRIRMIIDGYLIQNLQHLDFFDLVAPNLKIDVYLL